MKLEEGKTYIARDNSLHTITGKHGFQSFYETGGLYLSWHENGWVHGGSYGNHPHDLIAEAEPDFGLPLYPIEDAPGWFSGEPGVLLSDLGRGHRRSATMSGTFAQL